MSIVLQSTGGGSVTINEPTTASNFTQTLPASTGTILTTGSPQSGGVIQVVQSTKTDAAGVACTSQWVNIPAQGGSGTFSASITPKFATSKILVIVDLHGGATSAQVTRTRLLRDGSVIYAGDSAGSRPLGFGQLYTSNAVEIASLHASYLDSPATTSLVTYSLQAGTDNTSGTAYINQSQRDNNGTGYDTRTASSITLMEIAA